MHQFLIILIGNCIDLAVVPRMSLVVPVVKGFVVLVLLAML